MGPTTLHVTCALELIRNNNNHFHYKNKQTVKQRVHCAETLLI